MKSLMIIGHVSKKLHNEEKETNLPLRWCDIQLLPGEHG